MENLGYGLICSASNVALQCTLTATFKSMCAAQIAVPGTGNRHFFDFSNPALHIDWQFPSLALLENTEVLFFGFCEASKF